MAPQPSALSPGVLHTFDSLDLTAWPDGQGPCVWMSADTPSTVHADLYFKALKLYCLLCTTFKFAMTMSHFWTLWLQNSCNLPTIFHYISFQRACKFMLPTVRRFSALVLPWSLVCPHWRSPTGPGPPLVAYLALPSSTPGIRPHPLPAAANVTFHSYNQNQMIKWEKKNMMI